MDEELKELGDREPNSVYSNGLWDLSLALMKLSSLRDSSWGSSNALREQMKTMEASLLAKDNAMNKENTTQPAFISRLESELAGHEESVRVALDGQQAIKEEYVELSSKLTYVFKLHNRRANLSYMGSEASWRTHWLQERWSLRADQTAAYREGSSLWNHDEGLANPVSKEVAS
uniref:Uncharacterized protein n=1 Tax=Cannabis sativa TaxID=3483 RepID=A0A803Q2F2_CANSA